MRHYGLARANNPPYLAPGLDSGVLRWLVDQLTVMSREREIRKQIQALRRLGDRELRDIGLERSGVVQAVRLGGLARTRDE